MNFSGKISTLFSLLLLAAFMLGSFNGYANKIVVPVDGQSKESKKKNHSDKENKNTNERVSVGMEATISVFAVNFENNILIPFTKIEFVQSLSEKLLPLILGGKTQILETLLSRILPINAP